ncbi:MAG: hypothetical protein N3E40_03890, partial [Dehalococcoidia bacterium]|nr:hypothetical protein [Dehalococcoidia bacterium]
MATIKADTFDVGIYFFPGLEHVPAKCGDCQDTATIGEDGIGRVSKLCPGVENKDFLVLKATSDRFARDILVVYPYRFDLTNT